MRRRSMLYAALAGAAALVLPAGGGARTQALPFDAVVQNILSLHYQPAYVPAGFDTAFPTGANEPNTAPVPNTAPAEDYTSGSVPGDPDHPSWPYAFASHYLTKAQGLMGSDGAPLRGYLAMHPGTHPGMVVVHGFNTNGKESVIRWAAMLYAQGYDVLAADQRDFKDEFGNGEGSPDWLQTFGWKESQDVLAAGAYLKSQPGVGAVGIVGFSEGAQNTVLALAHDTTGIFSAGLTFSAPADQNAQIYSTAQPAGCQPPSCQYPATDALVNLVVPPYGSGGKYFDPCTVLTDAAAKYGTTRAAILSQEKAFHAQTAITVPLLNFYSRDDSLVQDFQAKMMAGYEVGHPLQRTIEIAQGEHAYFFDRWWQQKAILVYFASLLPGNYWENGIVGVDPTVLPTPGGAPLSTQLVDLGSPTPATADALGNAPLVCPGGPTAVALRSLSATRSTGHVVVSWRTGAEPQMAGFVVSRRTGARWTRVGSLVPARGGAGGAAYRLVDRRAGSLYRLQAVRADGGRVLLGTVRAMR